MKPIKRGMTEAVTRDGRRVTQLTWFDVDGDYNFNVVGVLDGLLHTWMEGGRFLDATRDSKKDIFAPVDYEWQWLVKDTEGNFAVTAFRKDESDIYDFFSSCKWSIHSRIEESKREVK